MSEAGTIAWSAMCGVMSFVLFVSTIVLFIKAVDVADSYGEAKKYAKYWAFGGVASVLSAVGLVGGAMYLANLY
jgi:hypothetical protein